MNEMRKILLVKDDALLLEVMRNILEADGFEIHPACNGKQALDYFANNRPDLIVSDNVMSEMAGMNCWRLYASCQMG
jgi:CheY-like chemotaxis protein